MSHALITIFLTFLLSASPQSTEQKALAYVERWSEVAVQQMKSSGVPASITLAQGMLESSYGFSMLATSGNNHFGIKCHDWKGKTIYYDDDAQNECFRKYDKAESSFEDHSAFLRYRDRYKFLFDFAVTDYKSWAYGLKKAGYATDPAYPEKLIRLIETYDLSRFDQEVAESTKKKASKGSKAGEPLPSPSTLETPVAIENSSAKKSKKKGLMESEPPAQREEVKGPSEVVSVAFSRQVYSQNGVPFVYASEGESLEAIAKANHLFLSEILKFNDLSEARELQPGEIVYLQAKKAKAAKHVDKYVSEGGESLWEVSQRFAVKLKRLTKLNDVAPDHLLTYEETIVLR